MQARLSFSVLLFSALLVLASPAFSAGGSAPSGKGVSPRCEAAIHKAAGNYSRCLLKTTAMYGKQGQRGKKFLAKQERCEINFNRRVGLAQDRYGEDQCTPYIIQIADRTVSYAKGVAIEAGGTPAPSYLFVQNGTGGTLSDTTLTLTDVSSKTGWFTDRPYRGSGQMNTEDFVALWDEGRPFADDPPDADFTCTVDSEVVNFVVELTSPSMPGDDLSYSVNAVGDTVLPETQITCEAESNLFIDTSTMGSPDSACTVVCIPCSLFGGVCGGGVWCVCGGVVDDL
jgi:hypothetical protein